MLGDLKKHKLFFIITTFALFFSFAFNIFGAVSTDEFILNYKDSEALVVNQVRCEGSLFADQLLEQKTKSDPAKLSTDCSKKSLEPYSSQFGLQGKVYTAGFTVLSKVMHISPMTYIAFSQLATALLSALTLSLLVLWVRSRIGKIPAITVAALVSLSPMLVGFSRNLYWALPLLILPVVYILYFYELNPTKKKAILFWAGLGVLFYLRYLCGYEYITTITIMAIAAATYVLFMNKVKLKVYLRQVIIIGVVSILSFGIAVLTHVGFLNISTGSTDESIQIIAERAKERTIDVDSYLQYPYANLKNLVGEHYKVTDTYLHYEKHAESGSRLWAAFAALSTYLLLPVIHLPITFSGSFGQYLQSFAMFIIVLVVLYITRKKWVIKKVTRQTEALFVALAVGLVGYISWLIVGYSHSLVHAHINGILMYLPFALFGFIILGLYVEFLISKFTKKYKR